MTSRDFNALVERAMQAGGRTHMRTVIEKELLHFDILFALDRASLLDQLTFQGGTALRLCYGSQRFSEDLDFVGGAGLNADRLQGLGEAVAERIESAHGLRVDVKEPRLVAAEAEDRKVAVHKWQIRVITAPERKDIPRQMIKIEVAAVPAYTRVARSLQAHYDFLPDGYHDLVVLVESPDELLADKLVSLPACTTYVRHRDIWDMHFLRQQGATADAAMVHQKARDYRVRDFRRLVERLIGRLPQIVHGKEFHDQMSRFIPLDVQESTLLKGKFLDMLEHETAQALRSVARAAPQ